MSNKTRALIVGLLFIVAYWLIWWAMQPEPVRVRPVNRYHGADAITTGWNGELTAYRWQGGKYRIMWVRGKG